jgi:phosphohistidine phosphatase
MRLLLLRHAKSARPDGVDDFDRALTDEGERSARLIGRYVRAHALCPARVLCSAALRAQQTMTCMISEFPKKPEVKLDRALYLGQPGQLLQLIHAQQDASPLMIVGHNPGLHEVGATLLASLQTDEARHHADKFLRKFTTAALAVLDFDVASWRQVTPGAGILCSYIQPKELIAPEEGA